MKVPFNVPTIVGTEDIYIKDCLDRRSIAAEHKFYKKCKTELQHLFNESEIFLTKSCTSSLEASSILFDIGPGDEVIMPSFTFATTATSFVNRGAN